jgi:hypothetical protein
VEGDVDVRCGSCKSSDVFKHDVLSSDVVGAVQQDRREEKER